MKINNTQTSKYGLFWQSIISKSKKREKKSTAILQTTNCTRFKVNLKSYSHQSNKK